jgi:hypothetical protein
MRFSSSFFWGSAHVLLMRAHDQLFNPYLPEWRSTRLELASSRVRKVLDGTACNSEPLKSCLLDQSAPSVVYQERVVKLAQITIYEYPDAIAFSTLRFLLSSLDDEPAQLRVRLQVFDNHSNPQTTLVVTPKVCFLIIIIIIIIVVIVIY